MAYDRHFRWELARKDLNWSMSDPRLYSEAFTGRAKPIPQCTYCLQFDHPAQCCEQEPPGMLSTRPASCSNELCRRYNEGHCRLTACHYVHSCRVCGGLIQHSPANRVIVVDDVAVIVQRGGIQAHSSSSPGLHPPGHGMGSEDLCRPLPALRPAVSTQEF